jgi:hypothetical protein
MMFQGNTLSLIKLPTSLSLHKSKPIINNVI